MTRIVQLIRLLASVVILLAACTFVVLYDRVATMRYPYDHPNTVGHWKGGEFVLENRACMRIHHRAPNPRLCGAPCRAPLGDRIYLALAAVPRACRTGYFRHVGLSPRLGRPRSSNLAASEHPADRSPTVVLLDSRTCPFFSSLCPFTGISAAGGPRPGVHAGSMGQRGMLVCRPPCQARSRAS